MHGTKRSLDRLPRTLKCGTARLRRSTCLCVVAELTLSDPESALLTPFASTTLHLLHRTHRLVSYLKRQM